MLDRLVEPKLNIEHVPYVLKSCFEFELSALAEAAIISNIRIVKAILLIFPLVTSLLS